jgi:hypothetical protein
VKLVPEMRGSEVKIWFVMKQESVCVRVHVCACTHVCMCVPVLRMEPRASCTLGKHFTPEPDAGF